MRQIEFRAWDKKAKVMVYPVVVYETQDHVGFSEETFRRCYDKDGWYEHLEMWEEWYYLFDDKVMQYTGLKDANGQKVFEGDILARDGFPNAEVCFHDLRWYPAIDSKYHVVIGDIYQNKELLNEVKNG